jgi:DNA polymerase III alpha subunit
MRLDKYSNPIFNEQDLFDAMYRGYQFNVADTLIVDRTDDIRQLEDRLGFRFIHPYENHKNIKDYDSACQSIWDMPEEYKTLDIAKWVLEKCKTQVELQRVGAELLEFQNKDMMPLLCWLKYLVDTMRQNNVVWGVGRGSSVASYVLYLIGVHKIDSMKYNLDWREFLR